MPTKCTLWSQPCWLLGVAVLQLFIHCAPDCSLSKIFLRAFSGFLLEVVNEILLAIPSILSRLVPLYSRFSGTQPCTAEKHGYLGGHGNVTCTKILLYHYQASRQLTPELSPPSPTPSMWNFAEPLPGTNYSLHVELC